LKQEKDLQKSLHYDKMKLEQELKLQVEEFLGKSKLSATATRQFVIDVRGNVE